MNEPAKPVRIDPGLYKFYEKVAKEEGRSVTAQINYILRQRIPRELYGLQHKQEHANMTDEERAVYEARIEKSRERGLAWKAKKDLLRGQPDSEQPIKHPDTQETERRYDEIMKDKEW